MILRTGKTGAERKRKMWYVIYNNGKPNEMVIACFKFLFHAEMFVEHLSHKEKYTIEREKGHDR